MSLKKLIESAQEGDIKSIEEIIRRIQKDIFSMFSHLIKTKELVSDLTQETLIKIAKNIHKLKDSTNFKAWINRIVTNTFYDYTRKQCKTPRIITDDILFDNIDKNIIEPIEFCLFTETDKMVKKALFQLPESLRITLILREYEGLSYEDISKITNTTIGTVKSRISRARAKLQNELRNFI